MFEEIKAIAADRLTADQIKLNSIAFGIMCNFPPFCGEPRAAEATKFVDKVFKRLAEYEDKVPELITEIDRLTTAIHAATERAEKAERRADVEYKIDVPVEHGYAITGFYFECSCGANYIDIPTVEENDWRYCPFCGGRISSRETYRCVECEDAEYDGDSYYCVNGGGVNCGENVDNACFDGCKYFKRRGEGEE